MGKGCGAPTTVRCPLQCVTGRPCTGHPCRSWAASRVKRQCRRRRRSRRSLLSFASGCLPYRTRRGSQLCGTRRCEAMLPLAFALCRRRWPNSAPAHRWLFNLSPGCLWRWTKGGKRRNGEAPRCVRCRQRRSCKGDPPPFQRSDRSISFDNAAPFLPPVICR